MIYPQYNISNNYSPYGQPSPQYAAPVVQDFSHHSASTEPVVEDDVGHYLPLSYKLLSAYGDALGTGRDLDYESIIEYEAACTTALTTGTITKAENERLGVIRNALFDRARVLRLVSYHSGVYTRCLRLIFLIMYARRPDSVEDWRTTGKTVDLNRTIFRDGEYDTLVRLLNENSCEIENAVYRSKGLDHLCTPNPRVLNYISLKSLEQEANRLASSGAGSNNGARELFLVKAEEAFRCGYISGEQLEHFRSLMDSPQVKGSGLHCMDLFD